MNTNAQTFSSSEIETVKSQFLQTGTSVSEWARKHGVNPALVYSILAGKNKCSRGQSHQVAILLGLKKLPERVIVQGLSETTDISS